MISCIVAAGFCARAESNKATRDFCLFHTLGFCFHLCTLVTGRNHNRSQYTDYCHNNNNSQLSVKPKLSEYFVLNIIFS